MADDENTSTISTDGGQSFAMVPYWLLKYPEPVSDGAIRTYAVLLMHAGCHGGPQNAAYPSRATLAHEIQKKSVRSVDGYIKELKKIGALRVISRKRPGSAENAVNHYVVVTIDPTTSNEVVHETAPRGAVDCSENKNQRTRTTSVSRPTSSSANVAPSPQAATAPDDKPAEAQTVPSPLQEIGDEDIKNQLLDIAVRASGDWQHYLNEDIPADRFEPPESIDVLEQSLNNLYDDVDRIVGDDICNKGWDERLARLIAQKPDRPRWGAAVWLNTYINWARLQ